MAARRKHAKKRPKARSRRKKMLRIDLVVEAQKHIVEQVGKFVEDAADMTMKGEFSPIAWIKRYSKMWSVLAGDLAKVTEKL